MSQIHISSEAGQSSNTKYPDNVRWLVVWYNVISYCESGQKIFFDYDFFFVFENFHSIEFDVFHNRRNSVFYAKLK